MTDSIKPFSAEQIRSIDYCAVHPGIGIARVGNSPDEWFYGPELPNVATPPEGGYKDTKGRIKRQAARFRIYAYDKDHNNLGELPLLDPVSPGNTPGGVARWSAHLANKKAAWHEFNAYQPSPRLRNAAVKERGQLEIDAGPRTICGPALSDARYHLTGGKFLGKEVPLGEIRTDEFARLVVLGGFGSAGPVVPGDPNPDCATEDYANNDNWHDDVSDGPVTASVTLSDGRSVSVEPAWVIVAPPNFAPGINSVVTLYDVIRDTACRAGWLDDHSRPVDYHRDIRPILLRAADTTWVNNNARRGHGYGKPGDYHAKDPAKALKIDKKMLDALSSPGKVRALVSADGETTVARRIFERLREPLDFKKNTPGMPDEQVEPADLADDDPRNGQATARFMPALSGDGGDTTDDEPRTWLTLLRSQYERFRRWSQGEFVAGEAERPVPWHDMSHEDQTAALQRAALEPCVGGAFFPGIEMSYAARWKRTFSSTFRIDQKSHSAGDVTKYMAVPWQADFYECNTNWWPAQRPDDVVPEELFDSVDGNWHKDSGVPISEGLEDRVRWDRGLGISTLFRRPWRNPATLLDDPALPDDADAKAPFGREDMVRYWAELGIVTPLRARNGELVHVERGRLPFAGMDVRQLFHALLNIDKHPDCRDKANEYVERMLQAARDVQAGPRAFARLDHIRPFAYTEDAFLRRMNDIYDDTLEFVAPNGSLAYDTKDPGVFRTREQVIERIRQLTPFNLLDGSWLRNIHRLGPVDEVNSILYSILNEELGGGVPSQNHANIWRDLCHSVGFYPSAAASSAFAQDPAFLNSAFDSPTFQLAISEFTTGYYPEIIGMTLFLEWSVLVLHRAADLLDDHDIDPHFYRMHIAIDNAASGHGARIVRAVMLHLSEVRKAGGEKAVQQQWRRIWDGYVAFGYTFSILIEQIKNLVARQPQADATTEQRLEWLEERLDLLIRSKKPYGQYNHGALTLGGPHGALINDLFDKPHAFRDKLIKDGWIVPGKPDESPFFELVRFEGGRHSRVVPKGNGEKGEVDKKVQVETPAPVVFEGGRMYRVFNDEEIKLWRDWTLEKGKEKPEKERDEGAWAVEQPKAGSAFLQAAAMRAAIPDADFARLRRAVSDRRLAIWLEDAARAATEAAREPAVPRPFARAQFAAKHVEQDRLAADLAGRLRQWLAWGMVRVLTHLSVLSCGRVRHLDLEIMDRAHAQTRLLSDWLAEIRDATNPAVPARRLMAAIAETPAIRNSVGTDTGFAADIKDPGTPIGRAFEVVIAGNDGRRAWETASEWLRNDCPLPEAEEPPAKPLSLDSTDAEEERHPTGVRFGFGTVH